MKKIIGYVPMKENKGKVVFVEDDAPRTNLVGQAVDTLFIYGDSANKIDASAIGKSITLEYGCGVKGKAYIANVHIK